MSTAQARRRTGSVPPEVRWLDATPALPDWLKPYLDGGLAEGVAWKFAPLQLFPDRHELSLDNDCILWELPAAIAAWLEDANDSVLVAEDVRAMLGQFSSLSGDAPRNLGLRGLPPHFDLTGALRRVLHDHPVMLESELDEQGLQLAALSRAQGMYVVSLEDVSICSPFPPHLPGLGRAGAHFCGLNARRLPWQLHGRPAELYVRDHWEEHRAQSSTIGCHCPWWHGKPRKRGAGKHGRA